MCDLSVFAPLLTYPDPALMAHINRARQQAADPEIMNHLDAFETALADMPAHALEEVYTRTFDLNPRCAPYVSVQVFGEEDPRRAQFMTGLNMRYAEAGLDAQGELPDHIALILRFIPHCDPGEWEDLQRHCLIPALTKMRDILSPTNNPYRHLFHALAALVAPQAHPEAAHA